MSERLYKENKIYQATVVGQLLTTSKGGDPQFRLEIELESILNGKSVDEGITELNDELCANKVIFFTFNPEPSRMARCFRDLTIIGLNSMDIALLDEDNPKGLKLKGKKVLVRPRYSADPTTGGENDWWNLVTPAVPPKKISADILKKFKSDNIEALTEAYSMKDRKADATVPF